MKLKINLIGFVLFAILFLNSCGIRQKKCSSFGIGSFVGSVNQTPLNRPNMVEKHEYLSEKTTCLAPAEFHNNTNNVLLEKTTKSKKSIKKENRILQKTNVIPEFSKKENKLENDEIVGTPTITKWAFILGILSIPSALLIGIYFLVPLAAVITSIISLAKHGSSSKAILGLTLGIFGFVASYFMLIALVGLAGMK